VIHPWNRLPTAFARSIKFRFCAVLAACAFASAASADGLVQITNRFDADPGWEGVNNRVQAENPPTKKQNIGWAQPKGSTNGAIGGVVWRSRTPAWYGVKVGPFSFNDALSASGTIMLDPRLQRGGAYFGFFNHARQEWRPWSSIAARVGDAGREPDGSLTADFTLDYMSTGWKAGGYGVGRFPVDAQFHKWSFTYEPNVIIATNNWPNPKLKEWLGDKRIPEDALLATARKDVAGMTMKQLRDLLEETEYHGLIEFSTRRGIGWQIRLNQQLMKGRIVCRLGEGPRKTHFLTHAMREEELVLDRFGIFNFQLPGDEFEFYLSDLTVNGQKINLSHDPDWEGKNNRTEFVERDFHAKQNFGYSHTHHAGKKAGEIGGTFWRTEPVDPLHGYYADDVGLLTLDDPMEFSGNIAFVAGGTDAGMVFGYFNSTNQMEEFKLEQGGEAGAPLPNNLLVAIEGPTRIGYYFSAQLTPADRSRNSHSDGPIFVPNAKRHAFRCKYDPTENNGLGRITLTLDNKEYKLDLNKEQRASGARFNRFGLINPRRGGKYVEVYLDDLSYTARRNPGQTPPPHQDKIVTVPYPAGGRKY
jgi:hypothetical protein